MKGRNTGYERAETRAAACMEVKDVANIVLSSVKQRQAEE
jgi:hypothetical protein